MLYSRAGDYPRGPAALYAESFSPNTPEGACPRCHGLGRVYEVTERSMVPDDSLTHPRARRSPPGRRPGTARTCATSLITLGYDVDRPWRELPKKDRDWILFTDEQPTVPGLRRATTPDEVRRALKRKEEPSYMGTFTERAALRAAHLRQHAERADEEARVAQYMVEQRLPALPRQAAAAASRCR